MLKRMEAGTYHFNGIPKHVVAAYIVASFESETQYEFAHLKGPSAFPS
jgi:hypothetical protein